ncbi:MAG: hypothetical protein LBI54_07595 [Lachnospiraceae bacterium]|jgi:hypothetical protein|nr:hypothetical protein [Lachnospiraceae bacterium]
MNNEPVGIGEWILTYILFAIPVVGIIMMFVWAFGGGAKASKANFCKAMLIITLIGIGLSIVVGILFGATILALIASV